MPLPSSRDRVELESFRLDFEKVHGKTDLTKRYVSTWPLSQQRWLFEHHPEEYFAALPQFVQAYLTQGMKNAVAEGSLDDWQPELIRVFLNSQREDPHR